MANRKGFAEEARQQFGDQPGVEQRARMIFLLRVFAGLFAVVALRLMQLHLNPRLELTDEEKFHIGEVELREPRGEIYDRNGLLLASDRDVPSVWVDPRKLQNAEELAPRVAEKLGMTQDEVQQKFAKQDEKGNIRKFVWVKRWLPDVSTESLQELEELSGGALAVQHEPLRYYPQNDSAAHLLGFVNQDGKASEGVELMFDKHLKSIPGKLVARKDASRELLESQTYEYLEPKGGEKVQLTIDTKIQHTLERALDKRMVDQNAVGAMGIVMDPHTGAILAMATRPAFDPNRYKEFPAELRKNRAIIDVFEPGSAFKIVTASAALEHGLVTPDTMIDCEGGSFNPYGHRISDYHKMGVVNFSKCVEESSNIAMIKVAAMLGPERVEQWIRRFGFGKATSPHFPMESGGIFRSRSKWSRLSMGSLPMGQEISVTMPQLAKSFSMIANGGFEVEPYFVERSVSAFGESTYQHEPPSGARVISAKTAKTMQELLGRVCEFGTGQPARIPEYTVGGKTGTAQMKRKNGPGYDPDRYTAVFAGFAPVSNPRLVCVIVVQEPMVKLHYGGPVSGPVFAEVVRDALIRMNVTPDILAPEDLVEQVKPAEALVMAKVAVPAPVETDADSITERLTPEELKEMEALAEPMDPLALVPYRTAPVGPPMPDLTGMTKRQAKETLHALQVQWDPRGVGRVVSQTPPPGTPAGPGMLCAVEFAPPQPPLAVATKEEPDEQPATS
jgi:stage V sporulation protein D (sporulation-specific penicillin-binding protein)